MSTINNKRLMHKVPPLLRLDNTSSKDMFEPHLVSIGPYHHGKLELELAEKLKPRAVQMFLDGSHNKDREFYLKKILETIKDVRSCYIEGSTVEYNDAYLATMMLQDACFLLKCDAMSKDPAALYQAGRFLFQYVFHDIVLLENQIPLSILKLLDDSSRDGNGGSETLLDNFVTKYFLFNPYRFKQKLGGSDQEDEPLHLLELARRTCYLAEDTSTMKHSKSSQSKFVQLVISKFPKSLLCISNTTTTTNNNNGEEVVDIEEYGSEWCEYSIRSAMDLKARGIHFQVNTSSDNCCLEDIKFKSNYFYGELQLPKWNVTIFTKVVLSNVLALENYYAEDQCVVTAYVNIMKILLQSTNDVKELREKKVLVNQLRTDEDLLQVFLDLPVTTWDTLPPFSDVLDEVEEHYRKPTNKWVGELIQTYFSSPWTAMALISAALLLCLTMIQAYFAVHPNNPKKNS